MQKDRLLTPACLDVPPGDRAAIVDALYRFCAGQDLKDRALFESAFAAHARLDFSGPAARFGIELPVFEGLAAISDTVLSTTANLDTTHSVSNPRITQFDGERATLFALVEAQHLPRGDHARHLLLKNIYALELARTRAHHWIITDMTITNVWFTGDSGVLFA